jgi:hypothetical protein
MSKRGDSAVLFDLWGQRGWYRVDVAGEHFHMQDIKSLFRSGVPEGGAELDVTVEFVPEPTNRHDRGAVKVMVGSAHVGYLPKETAAAYRPVIAELISAGFAPRCGAQVRAWHEFDYDLQRNGDVKKHSTGIEARITLDLAEPHMLTPLNAAPTVAHLVLPVGTAVQVGGEEEHMETLRGWTRPAGEGWVHVSLHQITEQMARSTRSVVEVRLDRQRVGQLTPKMSGEFAPAIALLERSGLLTVARAVVKGNSLKADVVLYAAKAGELDEGWLRKSIDGASASHARALIDTPHEPEAVAAPIVSAIEVAPNIQAEVVGSDVPMAPQVQPGGWFPDPSGAGGLRWWDGTAWTEHRADRPPLTAATTDSSQPDAGAAGGTAPVHADYTTQTMSTRIEGYMIAVEYDDRVLRVHANNGLARVALAGPDHDKGDVVIPRGAIAAVTFKVATPLVNGHLVVTTSNGRVYQMHFRRKQQDDFARLAHELGA